MTTVSIPDPDQLAITTIRTLCVDAVQQTKFGSTPETVVGLAKERVERSRAG